MNYPQSGQPIPPGFAGLGKVNETGRQMTVPVQIIINEVENGYVIANYGKTSVATSIDELLGHVERLLRHEDTN